MFFVGGILLGALLSAHFLTNGDPVEISPALRNELRGYGIMQISGLVPEQLFNWKELFTARGIILLIGGGFLVGFGTRYAGGCTSGHSIMGLSNLQWPSLVATISFMAGGFMMANLILPLILNINP